MDLDGRSDIYSLGCVLYEMLAGLPPFTGPTRAAVLARAMAEGIPSLKTVCPSVPTPVEQAVVKALAKRPDDRFDGAADFARALGCDLGAPSRARVTTASDARIRHAHPIASAYLRRMCPMIAALPPAERPRERLWSLGPPALTSVELLAILLGTGTGGRTALDLAADLLQVGAGSLRRVAMRPRAELLQIEGIGPGKGARLLAAFEVGARLAGEDRPAATRIREPEDVARLFQTEAARSPGRGVPPSRAGQPEPGAAPGPGHPRPPRTARWYIRGRSSGPPSPRRPRASSWCTTTPAATHPLGGRPYRHPPAGRGGTPAGFPAVRSRSDHRRPVRQLAAAGLL